MASPDFDLKIFLSYELGGPVKPNMEKGKRKEIPEKSPRTTIRTPGIGVSNIKDKSKQAPRHWTDVFDK